MNNFENMKLIFLNFGIVKAWVSQERGISHLFFEYHYFKGNRIVWYQAFYTTILGVFDKEAREWATLPILFLNGYLLIQQFHFKAIFKYIIRFFIWTLNRNWITNALKYICIISFTKICPNFAERILFIWKKWFKSGDCRGVPSSTHQSRPHERGQESPFLRKGAPQSPRSLIHVKLLFTCQWNLVLLSGQPQGKLVFTTHFHALMQWATVNKKVGSQNLYVLWSGKPIFQYFPALN